MIGGAIKVTTRSRFDAERLSGTSESLGCEQLAEGSGPASNVEVAFVDRDLPCHTRITIDGTAQHDASRSGGVTVDDQVGETSRWRVNGTGSNRWKTSALPRDEARLSR